MKFTEFIKETLSDESHHISSKRVCGVLGWIVCLSVLVYCSIAVIQAPIMIDTVIVTSTALLGLDSVTDIWKGKNEKVEILQRKQEDRECTED